MKDEPYGAGMGLTRIINGKRVHLNKIKKKDVQRMDKVVEMAKLHDDLLAKQDWVGLQKLANEYEKRGMVTTAGKIRREIPTQLV